MRTGETIAERFVIEAVAGRGGMATVYRAFDRIEGRLVALKIMRGEMLQEVSRFERECAILASLSHPGIVRYVSHGLDARGCPFMAMQWLDGESLSQRLSRAPLSVSESLVMVGAVAQALAVAHAAGLVHRDVKPSNLVLPGGATDRPVLIDFGIARGGGAERLTATGVAIGSWAYMAPEQAAGLVSPDARADVFSLGCVLYLCLTGVRPFEGEEPAVILAKVLSEQPRPIHALRSGLDPALEALVERMLSKDPAQRPVDGQAVATAVRSLSASGEASMGPSPRVPVALTDTEQRLSWVLTVARARDWAPTVTDGQRGDLAGDDPETRLRVLLARAGDGTGYMPDGTAVIALQSRGAPTDCARRATRLALRLARQLEGATLAVVGGLTAGSGTEPLGDLALAGRALLARAPEGSVVIDELTAGLARGAFELAPREGVATVTAERPDADVGRRLLGRRTTCVGRKRELATLTACLDECFCEPVARVVLVTGAAGSGKSRLRHELLRRLRTSDHGARIMLGRADPMGAGASLASLASALRPALGVREDAPVEQRRQAIEASVESMGAGGARPGTAATLGDLVGVPFPESARGSLDAARHDPGVLGDAMRAAFESWLAAACERGPVMLVLEDLHHADPASVDFVDAALRALADAPFMVLALARPGVHERFPRLWGERELQEIRITSLTKRAGGQLVREVLGDGIAEAEVARIVELSEGNAFFLEELIRAAADEGGERPAPRSVVGMLTARLDELHPGARRILRAGSVFGATFDDAGVTALVGEDLAERELDHWLHELADRELIMALDQRSTGARGYRFRHALVQEAVYDTLTERDRLTGHRLAADHLEARGEEDPMVMAEHWIRADLQERAVGALERAAELALESNDFRGTIDRAERAMESGAGETTRGRLRLMQADALRWLGEDEESGTRATEAGGLLPSGSAAWFRAMGIACSAGSRLTGDSHVLALVGAARAVDPDPAALPDAVICLCRAGTALLQALEYELVDELFAQATSWAARFEQIPPVVSMWLEWSLGLRAQHAGDTVMQLRHQLRATSAAEQAGDRRRACVRRLGLGYAYGSLGDWRRAEDALSAALATALELGIHVTAAYAKENLGLVYAHIGRIEDAYAMEDEVLRACAQIPSPHLHAGARIYRAIIAHRAGDAVQAECEAREALALVEAIPSLRGEALGWLARALLEQERGDEALAAAREAMGILRQEGGLEDGEQVVRLAHAEALRATGDLDGARRALGEAVQRLRRTASAISDEGLRASFLGAVPENARTLELWTTWEPETGAG